MEDDYRVYGTRQKSRLGVTEVSRQMNTLRGRASGNAHRGHWCGRGRCGKIPLELGTGSVMPGGGGRMRVLQVGAYCAVMACAFGKASAMKSGDADPSLLLQSVPTYAAESEARAACGNDAVVWADRYAGYYYSRNERQFAATPDGAFACKQAAERANYWDTDPRSSMSGQPGKRIPYRPLYVGS